LNHLLAADHFVDDVTFDDISVQGGTLTHAEEFKLFSKCPDSIVDLVRICK
jgi:hypothetical protein